MLVVGTIVSFSFVCVRDSWPGKLGWVVDS